MKKVLEMSRIILLLSIFFLPCNTYETNRNDIPNGSSVPHPCSTVKSVKFWEGVGHNKDRGAGPLNPFGQDFKAENKIWTKYLCTKDSDGDGRTNGEELGDPNCIWTKGGQPQFKATGHPGICEPIGSFLCRNKRNPCINPPE